MGKFMALGATVPQVSSEVRTVQSNLLRSALILTIHSTCLCETAGKDSHVVVALGDRNDDVESGAGDQST